MILDALPVLRMRYNTACPCARLRCRTVYRHMDRRATNAEARVERAEEEATRERELRATAEASLEACKSRLEVCFAAACSHVMCLPLVGFGVFVGVVGNT